MLLDAKLREDEEIAVFRGRHAGQSVLAVLPVLDRPAPEVVKRLEHEFALREELTLPWSAPPLEFLRQDGKVALVLLDPGGMSLTTLLQRRPTVAECLKLGAGLAASLSQVHARALLHKNLKPEHVLVDLATGAVSLTGFGLAGHQARGLPEAVPPETFAGTLAYMAPEQTGRMNCGVDARSDLYAFGVLLYEALTGTLPFTAGDPLELIHAHLARPPVPPAERNPALPSLLSDLVLKLLAKTPEERYQTALGVEADLRRCLEAWERAGRVDPFPLAEQDVPDRLFLPEKLYGREREVEALLAAWGRAIKRGGPELVLVSGFPGVGKSSLVHALQRAARTSRGNFAAGKFDQYQRGIPYATLAEALRSLLRSLLAGPEEEVARWRDDLADALHPNGGVLAELVPELEHLLGPQPPVPDLAPREAQDRFRGVFVQFLGALAKEAHPLALFLDDLQWLDSETLELLQPLLTHPGLRHLLLLGAYRDNEVPESHPLTTTISSLRKTGTLVTDMVLSPLAHEDAVALVSDMLRSPRERVEPLARLAQEKSGGNPFFLIHFLTNLHAEGLLLFSAKEGGWTWDLERVSAKGYTDNVLDLMARKLARLPPPSQDALKALALLGQGAELELLVWVLDIPGVRVRAHLREAERAGLIEGSGSRYAFIHDRIREAAYALIQPEARAREHLRLGRLLLADRRAEDVEADLFTLVNHFRQALALLEDMEERDRVRGLFIRAGKAAKATTAFRAARDHFAEASGLLPADRWSAPYEEVFPLLLELAECEYLVEDLDRGNELFDKLVAHASSDIDKAAVHHLRVRLYAIPPGTIIEAQRIGLEGLRLLGLACPEGDEAMAEAIRADEAAIAALLRLHGMPDQAATPKIDDPRAVALLDQLADTLGRSSQSPLQMRWLTLQGLKVCLGLGHTASSAVIYTYYAVLLLPFPGRIREALAFSDLAIALNARYNDLRRRPAVLAFYAGLVHSWGRPFAAAKPLFDKGLMAAQMAWDRANGPAIGVVAVWMGFEAGEPLAEVRAGAGGFLGYVAHFSKLYTHLIRQYVQLLACLEGRTAGLVSFDDAEFKEEEALETYRQVGYDFGIWQFWALKMIAATYLRQPEEALRCVLAQRGIPMPFFSTLEAAEAFCHALAVTALHAQAPAERRADLAATLEDILPRLKRWADDCPENFLHRYQLVLAEKARIEGQDLEAMRLYEQAIASARRNGLLHMESLACEQAARFYLERGLSRNAYAHLREARAGYLRWGATAKVAQLDREFSGIGQPAFPSPTATLGASVAQLDLPHVIQASQAVSGEIELGRLVERLLRLVLEQAGADRGLLLQSEGEDFLVEAEASTGPEGLSIQLPRAPFAPGDLSEGVFRYVVRTRERILLDDAAAPGNLFAEDAYLRRQKPRSLLCLPLLKQSRLVGVLYLENRLAAGVFTPSRVATLEVLASQAAIALENARLYAALESERSRLQAVIQQVPAGLIIAEAPSGRLLVTNDKALEIARWTEQLVGSVGEFSRYVGFRPDGRRYESGDWPLARALATGETISAEEIEMLWEDGTRSCLSVSAAPIRDSDGRLAAAVAVFQDITERRRREEALKASEERFAKVFHNSPTAMAVLRRKDWTLAEVNEGFLSLLGYRRDEVVGRFSMELGTWFRELLEQAGRRLAEGKPFRGEDFEAADKAGRPKALLVSVDAIELERESCYLASFADLTERKHVEEQLRQSQKMEAIGSLAGGVAHDFNNLLTAINGYSELLQMGLEVSDPKQDLVQPIRAAGERAAGLTRQLLAFSRKEEVHTRVQSLNVIVEEMEGMLTRLIEEHVALSTRLDPEAGFIDADRGQVEQILLNLVVNARDAMPNGGELRVETQHVILERPPKDALLPVAPGRYVVLTVRDTGTGMTPEVRAKIFEPFFTTKGVGKGTGLGLAVVYGILKRLGGGIVVRSVVGQGTTFRIYIPEAKEPGEEIEVARVKASEHLQGKERVLVVEDEDSVRTFIRQALSAQGYQVVMARNGREALEMLKRGVAVDMVLTDLIMPDLGGRELADRVREFSPGLPILYTSGYSRDVGRFQEMLANGEHFLAKPFGPVEVARKVREILDKSQNEG